MTRTTLGAFGFALVMLGGEVSVLAQQTADLSRPYQGLFGRRAQAPSPQTLDITAVLVEAYDDDVYGDMASLNPLVPRMDGYYTMLQADANYGWQVPRRQFGASAGSVFRYYHGHDLKHVDVTNFNAAVGGSTQFTERTSFFVNQTMAYSPSYLYRLFPGVDQLGPGDVDPSAPDYRVNDTASYAFTTVGRLTHKVSPRGTLSATADYSYINYTGDNPEQLQRDARTFGIHGQFARNLTRNTVARIGYRYRDGDLGIGLTAPTVEHGVDVGVDYIRPLSATRRALIGFSFGSSAVSVPESPVEAVSAQQVYRAVGNVSLGYQFGRTWQTKATYRRGLDYIAELNQPVFSDGVTAVLEGLFTPRLDLLVSAGYSSGESAFFANTSTFATYTTHVRSRYALTPSWALQLEYMYYYYDFTGRLTLPIGMPSNMERSGIRAGVTFWIPALRR
jgi:hypothetical protein